ncbi:MAG: (Fe-S)-binding protein [Candidatus Njordarchaeia archaeon]
MNGLEKYEEDLKKNLFLVKICRSSCPIAQVTGVETYTNHSILQIIYYLHNGQLDWTPENVEPIYMCNLCGRCNHACEIINFREIIEVARATAYQGGVAPKKILKARELILKTLTETQKNLEQMKPREEGNKTLLIGGYNYNRDLQLMKTAKELFDKLGIPYDYLGAKEPYSGQNLFDLGIIDEALKHANTMANILNRYEQIIVLDPATYQTLKQRYPRYGIEIKPKIYHYTEYLTQHYINNLEPKIEIEGKTAYSDPCELAQIGIIKEPREIIKALGIETIDLPRKGKATYPTGSCGSFDLVDKETADQVTIEKLGEILDLKTENLITTSIREKEDIKTMTEKAGIKLNIYDLIEIIDTK